METCLMLYSAVCQLQPWYQDSYMRNDDHFGPVLKALNRSFVSLVNQRVHTVKQKWNYMLTYEL